MIDEIQGEIEISKIDVEMLKSDIFNCLNILYCIRDIALTNAYRGISLLSSGAISHLKDIESIMKQNELTAHTR